MPNRFLVFRAQQPWKVTAQFENFELPSAGEWRRPKSFISGKELKDVLDCDLAAAEARARQVLKKTPGDPVALCLLGTALRRQGQDGLAISILEPLTQSQPQMEMAWRELGLAYVKLGSHAQAMNPLLRAIDLNWLDNDVWYALGDVLTFPGCKPPLDDRRLAEAEAALRDRRLETAEALLRSVLEERPHDAAAIKLLADVLLHTDRWAEFKPLLERCLDIAPDFMAARFRCATMYFTHNEYRSALPHLDELLRSDPDNILLRGLKSLALTWGQKFDLAIAEFESFIAETSCQPGLWLEYARLLRIARRRNAIDAFKTAIGLLPSLVEAYVGVAHAKSLRVDQDLIDLARAQLARTDLPIEDRARLHFVLGRAFEDMERYAESFDNYRKSNAILYGAREVDVAVGRAHTRRAKQFFTPAFFNRHANVGCPQDGAIFIVGLPRAGSTLVEQILGSHSAIEPLGELPDLPALLKKAFPEPERGLDGPAYPFLLNEIGPDRIRLLGEEYMAATSRLRKTGKPLFIDKLPGNFAYVGLIHLILPHARIIDARRHPLDCCFSCYKHYFPGGLQLTLDLRDLGRSYCDYVELMAHFDEVLPGRVHRNVYERLIANFEAEVRGMLDHLGLPFEEACLRFHEHGRLVKTLSADQVNLPLYRTAMAHWRRYGQWLGPLKESLGHVLDLYPEVPKFYPEVRARWSKPLRLGQSSGRFTTFRGLHQFPFEIASRPANPMAV